MALWLPGVPLLRLQWEFSGSKTSDPKNDVSSEKQHGVQDVFVKPWHDMNHEILIVSYGSL